MGKHVPWLWAAILALSLLVAACDASPATPTSIPTPAPTATLAPSPTPTVRPTATPPPTAAPGSRTPAVVTEITDGDTILVDIGSVEYRVRFISIDTPETAHPTLGAEWLGYEASDYLKSMLKVGDTVMLEKDFSDVDIYNRLLRYVWKGDLNLNAEMVKAGLALVSTYEPDVKYDKEFRALQREAANKGVGLWGPRPTPPAIRAEFEHENAYLVSPAGQATVPLLDGANRGEVVSVWPAGVKVFLQDIYWDAKSARWWYWASIQDFRGWVTADYLSKNPPAMQPPNAPVRFMGYQEAVTSGAVPVRDKPGGTASIVRQLEAGAPATVTRLGWADGQWWYLVSVNGPDGWVPQDALEPPRP
jgi:endonuclease YncB( thermonuclease family)